MPVRGSSRHAQVHSEISVCFYQPPKRAQIAARCRYSRSDAAPTEASMALVPILQPAENLQAAAGGSLYAERIAELELRTRYLNMRHEPAKQFQLPAARGGLKTAFWQTVAVQES